MTRITNSTGAMIAFLLGVGFVGFVAPGIYTWITTAFTGDELILFIVGLLAVSIYLVIIQPILIATQDSEKA